MIYSTGAAIAANASRALSVAGNIAADNFTSTVKNFPQIVANEFKSAFYWPIEHPVESAFMALGGSNLAIGFHATEVANLESIMQNGLRNSVAGRLGGGGVYANNTSAGALAEFRNYNPTGSYEMLSGMYFRGQNMVVEGTSAKFRIYGNFPFSQGADTISHQSLRAPGTTNTLIRNRSFNIFR